MKTAAVFRVVILLSSLALSTSPTSAPGEDGAASVPSPSPSPAVQTAETPFDPTPGISSPFGDREPAKEVPILKPKRRPRGKTARTPASEEGTAGNLESEVRTSQRPIEIGLALTTGALFFSTSDNARAQDRSAQGLTQNLSLGVQGDLHAFKYLGADFDFFYGIAGTQDITFTSGTTQTEQNKSLQGNGLMVHARGELPFNFSGVPIVPYAGLGFGWAALQENITDSQGNVTSNSLNTTGLMATVGVSAEPFRKFTLAGDFATSVTASASFSAATTSVSGSLSRIRLSGLYGFANHFSGGVQFAHRGVSAASAATTGTSTTAPGANETQDQLLALVRYLF